MLCSACLTSDGNTQSGIDPSGLNHPYIPPCYQQHSNNSRSINFALRVNLAFPILYVLATIVICGLPMIITPVETIIGLCMILSGIYSNIIALRKYLIFDILGVPVYFIFVWWKNKPEMIRRWSSKILQEPISNRSYRSYKSQYLQALVNLKRFLELTIS